MKRLVTRRGIARVVGLVGLAACSQVAAVHHPVQYVAEKTPQQVWIVRRHNDSVYAMQSPRLEGDTLVGFTLPTEKTLAQYVEIPGMDIKQMRARQAAPIRTGALLLGLTGAFVFVYQKEVGSSSGAALKQGDDACFCDFDDICC